MQFPTAEECNDYFNRYIQQVPQRDPLLLLEQTQQYAEVVLAKVPPTQYHQAYAPGKWTPSQLLVHLIDTEHILSYRALRFARGDQQPVLPFDQDQYVAVVPTTDLDWDMLVQTWAHLRHYTLLQFKQYKPEVAARAGSTTFPCSVRGVAAILSGHAIHHLKVLQERYLGLTPLELDAVLTTS